MKFSQVLASAGVLILAACQLPVMAPDGRDNDHKVLLRGAWTKTTSLSPTDLIARLKAFEEGRWTLAIAGTPTCGVDVFHYEYNTTDGKGVPVTASSALMVPRGADAKCSNPNPVVLAMHGTMPDKSYNLADLSGDNPASARALAWAGVYASQGYIVVAPNYTGLDTSNASHQSYLDAAQQTEDVIDALGAARDLLPSVSGSASDRLFLVGYSQGGWLTMATHREMEARGITLTASVPSSGPYALTAIVDDVFRGRPVQGSTVYLPLAIRAFQEAYGDIYGQPSEVYNPAIAQDVATLLPNATPHHLLIQAGRLPASAVFSNKSIIPADVSPAVRSILEGESPAKSPASFARVYALGFGANYLLNDTFRVEYLQDIETHADGAWPNYTTGEIPTGSGNGLRRAVIRNDLRGWTPQKPMIMCGGSGDMAAPFRYGGELMMRYWSAPERAPKPGLVSLLDIESPITENDPFGVLKTDFRMRKDQFLREAAMPDWVDPYHQLLLPRYCYTAALQLFETLR